MYHQRREDNENRTVWCGNIGPEIPDAVIYELFNQAGPVEGVRRPRDANGNPKGFAFIEFKQESSVPYVLKLFKGTKLANQVLKLNARGNNSSYTPVLGTHLTDAQVANMGQPQSHMGQPQPHTAEARELRRCRSRSRSRSRSRPESSSDRPQNWAEFNALRGKGSLSGDLTYRTDLMGRANQSTGQQPNFSVPPNFEALLQMGQQMLIPGGGTGMPFFNPMSGMGSILPVIPVPVSYPSTSTSGAPDPSGWGRGGSDFNRGDAQREGGYHRDEGGRSSDYDRRELRRDDDYRREVRGRGNYESRDVRGRDDSDRREFRGRDDHGRRGNEGRDDRRDGRRDIGYDRGRENRDSRENRSYQPYDRRQSHLYNQPSYSRESRDRRRN